MPSKSNFSARTCSGAVVPKLGPEFKTLVDNTLYAIAAVAVISYLCHRLIPSPRALYANLRVSLRRRLLHAEATQVLTVVCQTKKLSTLEFAIRKTSTIKSLRQYVARCMGATIEEVNLVVQQGDGSGNVILLCPVANDERPASELIGGGIIRADFVPEDQLPRTKTKCRDNIPLSVLGKLFLSWAFFFWLVLVLFIALNTPMLDALQAAPLPGWLYEILRNTLESLTLPILAFAIVIFIIGLLLLLSELVDCIVWLSYELLPPRVFVACSAAVILAPLFCLLRYGLLKDTQSRRGYGPRVRLAFRMIIVIIAIIVVGLVLYNWFTDVVVTRDVIKLLSFLQTSTTNTVDTFKIASNNVQIVERLGQNQSIGQGQGAAGLPDLSSVSAILVLASQAVDTQEVNRFKNVGVAGVLIRSILQFILTKSLVLVVVGILVAVKRNSTTMLKNVGIFGCLCIGILLVFCALNFFSFAVIDETCCGLRTFLANPANSSVPSLVKVFSFCAIRDSNDLLTPLTMATARINALRSELRSQLKLDLGIDAFPNSTDFVLPSGVLGVPSGVPGGLPAVPSLLAFQPSAGDAEQLKQAGQQQTEDEENPDAAGVVMNAQVATTGGEAADVKTQLTDGSITDQVTGSLKAKIELIIVKLEVLLITISIFSTLTSLLSCEPIKWTLAGVNSDLCDTISPSLHKVAAAQFFCGCVGLLLLSLLSVLLHMMHYPRKRWRCPQCGVFFKYKVSLKSHVKVSHRRDLSLTVDAKFRTFSVDAEEQQHAQMRPEFFELLKDAAVRDIIRAFSAIGRAQGWAAYGTVAVTSENIDVSIRESDGAAHNLYTLDVTWDDCLCSDPSKRGILIERLVAGSVENVFDKNALVALDSFEAIHQMVQEHGFLAADVKAVVCGNNNQGSCCSSPDHKLGHSKVSIRPACVEYVGLFRAVEGAANVGEQTFCDNVLQHATSKVAEVYPFGCNLLHRPLSTPAHNLTDLSIFPGGLLGLYRRSLKRNFSREGQASLERAVFSVIASLSTLNAPKTGDPHDCDGLIGLHAEGVSILAEEDMERLQQLDVDFGEFHDKTRPKYWQAFCQYRTRPKYRTEQNTSKVLASILSPDSSGTTYSRQFVESLLLSLSDSGGSSNLWTLPISKIAPHLDPQKIDPGFFSTHDRTRLDALSVIEALGKSGRCVDVLSLCTTLNSAATVSHLPGTGPLPVVGALKTVALYRIRFLNFSERCRRQMLLYCDRLVAALSVVSLPLLEGSSQLFCSMTLVYICMSLVQFDSFALFAAGVLGSGALGWYSSWDFYTSTEARAAFFIAAMGFFTAALGVTFEYRHAEAVLANECHVAACNTLGLCNLAALLKAEGSYNCSFDVMARNVQVALFSLQDAFFLFLFIIPPALIHCLAASRLLSASEKASCNRTIFLRMGNKVKADHVSCSSVSVDDIADMSLINPRLLALADSFMHRLQMASAGRKEISKYVRLQSHCSPAVLISCVAFTALALVFFGVSVARGEGSSLIFDGCNGFHHLCGLSASSVIWQTSVNPHATLLNGFVDVAHFDTIFSQFNAGTRAFSFTHATTSPDGADLSLCGPNLECRFGNITLSAALTDLKAALDQDKSHVGQNAVIVLVSGVNITSQSLNSSFAKAGLLDAVHPLPDAQPWPTLRELAGRVFVLADVHSGPPLSWASSLSSRTFETRRRSSATDQCVPTLSQINQPNATRMFIVNAYLDTPMTSPSLAYTSNYKTHLRALINSCSNVTGGTWPSFLAVNFVRIGDTKQVIDELNEPSEFRGFGVGLKEHQETFTAVGTTFVVVFFCALAVSMLREGHDFDATTTLGAEPVEAAASETINPLHLDAADPLPRSIDEAPAAHETVNEASERAPRKLVNYRGSARRSIEINL